MWICNYPETSFTQDIICKPQAKKTKHIIGADYLDIFPFFKFWEEKKKKNERKPLQGRFLLLSSLATRLWRVSWKVGITFFSV